MKRVFWWGIGSWLATAALVFFALPGDGELLRGVLSGGAAAIAGGIAAFLSE